MDIKKKNEREKIMNSMDEIYHIRDNFIIVGLTGKYQSGCSFVASELCHKDKNIQKIFNEHSKTISKEFNKKRSSYYKAARETSMRLDAAKDTEHLSKKKRELYELAYKSRKLEIIGEYLTKNYEKFNIINVHQLIILHAVHNVNDKRSEELRNRLYSNDADSKQGTNEDASSGVKENKIVARRIEKIKQLLENNKSKLQTFDVLLYGDDDMFKANIEALKKDYNIFVEITNSIIEKIHILLGDDYKFEVLLEEWACQLRTVGLIYDYNVFTSLYKEKFLVDANAVISENTSLTLARTINRTIKVMRRSINDCSKIVIDKLINPLEVVFLRERYSTFFLLAINRTDNISVCPSWPDDWDDEVNGPATRHDNITYVKSKVSEFVWEILRTNVNECIKLADIQINNYSTEKDLLSKVAYYVALMLHPGIVQPSATERIMQIAYTASLSSGCLSRQVGAVVTNENFSVKAVGWNSSPSGQLPCTMRCFHGLVSKKDDYSNFYSEFERSNPKFVEHCKKLQSIYKQTLIEKELHGLPLLFCFKDIYTTYSSDDKDNQVHTRSLHAEENAFLQLAKYGSPGIKNGILFTTDQCCVLCAKKAYQLGITKIYYIDTYKDIAPVHILRCPHPSHPNMPEQIHYEGAVGPAYSKIYMPFFSQKDEICCRLRINMKNESSNISSGENSAQPPSPKPKNVNAGNIDKQIQG